MGLPAPNWDSQAEPLITPILQIFNPNQPENVVALFPDESKGQIQPAFAPKKGTVGPTQAPKPGTSPSTSTAALGVGFLLGWNEAWAKGEEARKTANDATPFTDEVLKKELQALIGVVLWVQNAAMPQLALDIATKQLKSKKPTEGRVMIHGWSKR